MKKFIILSILLAFIQIYAQVKIQPPMADKTFEYVKLDSIWEGFPLAKADAIVPNFFIIPDVKLPESVWFAITDMSLALGNWIDDPDFEVRDIIQGKTPQLIYSSLSDVPDTRKNIILIKHPNSAKVATPTITVKMDGRRKIMTIMATDDQQLTQAIRYITRVISFKATAYKTFFAFTKLRGMIEKENFDAAFALVKNVNGLSACGRNMVLVQPKVAHFPAEMKKLVKKRNKLLYKELPMALSEKNKEKALTAWQESMITCYACHQGTSSMPAVRKFTPGEEPHRLHQKVAEIYNLEEGCNTCHHDETSLKGYK